MNLRLPFVALLLMACQGPPDAGSAQKPKDAASTTQAGSSLEHPATSVGRRDHTWRPLMTWNPSPRLLPGGLVLFLHAACGGLGGQSDAAGNASDNPRAENAAEERPVPTQGHAPPNGCGNSSGPPSTAADGPPDASSEVTEGGPERGSEEGSKSPPSDDGSDSPTADVESRDDGDEFPLTGLYATHWRMVATYEVPNPFGADSMSGEGETVVMGLARIEAEGEGWTIEEWGCGGRSDIDLMGGVEITIPAALPMSVPPNRSRLEVVQEEGGWSWRRPEVATAVGVRMDDPAVDPLPEARDDARIWDQDGDGHPGVTVGVSTPLLSGDLYVAQRQRNTLHGGVADDGSLFGFIEDTGEQKVLDSDNILLRMDIVMRPPETLERNTVSMVPVDDGVDCAWLLGQADAVFE